MISPPAQPADDLTRSYSERLQHGEGSAYLAFHARDIAALTAALMTAHTAFGIEGGLVTLADPDLDFIVFVQDNRSPTDKPVHFAHPNGAVAMAAVWLTLDAPSRVSLRTLLLALGAVESNAVVRTSDNARADVFTVQNGRVVVLNADTRLTNRRQVIGVKFRFGHRQMARKFWGGLDATVAPSHAHGMRLLFDAEP